MTTPLVGELAFIIADHMQPRYRSVAFATLCQSVAATLEQIGIDEPPRSVWGTRRPRTPFLRRPDGRYECLVPDLVDVMNAVHELDTDAAAPMHQAGLAIGRMIERDIESDRQLDAILAEEYREAPKQ